MFNIYLNILVPIRMYLQPIAFLAVSQLKCNLFLCTETLYHAAKMSVFL